MTLGLYKSAPPQGGKLIFIQFPSLFLQAFPL